MHTGKAVSLARTQFTVTSAGLEMRVKARLARREGRALGGEFLNSERNEVINNRACRVATCEAGVVKQRIAQFAADVFSSFSDGSFSTRRISSG